MGSSLDVFEAVSNVARSWIWSLFFFVWPVRGSRGGGECCVGVRQAAGQLRGTTPQGTTPTGAHTSECGGRLLSLLLFPCHSHVCVKKDLFKLFLVYFKFSKY